MIVRALLVGAVLTLAAGLAAWLLTGYAGRVARRAEERKAGKGNASASGSPGREGGQR